MHTHANQHTCLILCCLIVTLRSLALGDTHLPSFEIVLLFIDAIFINSVAEQHVSSTSEILVGVSLASLVCVCLFGGSDTI